MENIKWAIDASHSDLTFKVRHMMITNVKGTFREWEGHLEFNPDNPENSYARAEINAASIDTGADDRDQHLRSADFFDVENHPKIVFESTGFERHTDTAFKVKGNLTMRGVTRDVEFEAEFLGKTTDPWGKQRVAFAADLEVHRKEWGLEWNQALETGGVLVSDRVRISVEVQAVRED